MLQNQPMNQQNQQSIMPQPPHVITTKDFSYINDMLAWNLLAMKKAHHAASQCQDQKIKNKLEACGQMHQQHYMKILGHLEEKQQNNSITQ
ncbi:hypothetical protein J14TS2_13920 [Bacillus sp. J14TS2]|uniref:hypothetical protein n=1 Tax=Bacillus sp. J14TS2 TaxID=2807188 RepID=UPI001B0ADADB|nr:hypothetical protein [Bacillus sp. J14TS2]GIN70917.1 hypothetical protein J14TS2_13920 [Bacillus sp. J14TS2]